MRKPLSPEQRVKDNARSYANVYLRRGKINRAPCEVCGGYAEMHHDDYSKPLDVRWLCRPHHLEWHINNDPVGDLIHPMETTVSTGGSAA